MRKRILITGASGFVGSHLVEAAKNLNFEVHAAVRRSSNITEIESFVDQFVFPDFSSVSELKKLFEKCQYHYIIHAAALTKAKEEKMLLDVNVGYTQHILEAAFAADMPLERLVYVSSLAAVGPIAYASDKLIDESTPYSPVTVYGRSKFTSEQMIKADFSDRPLSVFRPTAVYGPREKDLFILFETMNKGLDPYIGRKPQKLSFIYVKDLVNVLLKGCVVPQKGLQFYNITDGNIYSKYEMADIFKETLRRKLLRVHIPFSIVKKVAQISETIYKNSKRTPVIYPERLNELTAENWGCDISKAKNKLGFNPKYNLRQGLGESLVWYKENNWL
ncbi:NAD(P)-dependent oxidoreductase [Sphingobacterium alkalisoli]|uniref:NAD(P)-dependent oxidoreductase n=1 Tax=Sphingobacterium alkalisoli TaxID=1874115 RepID=A0A4U0H1N1_9SPHI|nr:NAD(P)-dependent oxidoreductase [Sphingobacterium alkalisoli]TJY64172.1 NAD(P)-dependent oxidoreductase [Sphingobacterium alkalisoli]GGH23406.1 NAD-dependent dehydratase [Sphingobacterium alkalisoli]